MHRHTEKAFLFQQHLPALGIWVICKPQQPLGRKKLPALHEQGELRKHCRVLSRGSETRTTTSETLCHQGARPGSTSQSSQKQIVHISPTSSSQQQQVNHSRRGDGKAKQRNTRNSEGRIEKPHQEWRSKLWALKDVLALTHRHSVLDCLSISGRKRDQPARKIRDAGAVI